TLTLDRGNLDTVPASLAPGATDYRSTRGQPDTVSGFALIVPDPGTYTPAASLLLTHLSGGIGALHATEEAQIPTTDLRLFEEISGDIEHGEGHSTGMAYAISNPNPAPATITLTLVNMDGTLQGLSSTFTLPAMGHIAIFLNEMADFMALPNPFQGTVRVHSTAPGIVAIGLRARYSENGNVVGTMTGPLKEHPGEGSKVIFPHVLDGG